MATLDLKPFGVNFVLRPGKNSISDIYSSLLSHGESYFFYPDNRVDPYDYIKVNGKKYTNLKYLGAGTYGTTYSGDGDDGYQYAIKLIHNVEHHNDIVNLMKESIQQIIIVGHTEDLENGPFAPILYDIGYDEYNKEAYIVSELMTNTIWNQISSQTIEENDEFVSVMLMHVSVNLILLQNDLKFNHRDLKTDNLMYTVNADGVINFKFIDFGFTCLTWEGMFINGGGYFKHSPTCFRLTRDIVQLITGIVWFHAEFISAKLKKRLMHFLETKRDGGKTQKLTTRMKEWTNSYRLLDRNNYVFELGNPKMVYDEMIRFGEGKPFKGIRASRKSVRKPAQLGSVEVAICPADKIINPKTRRCVLRTGAIGRKLEKEMAVPVAEPEPAPELAPESDTCPPGKIRNPKTRRCVKRDGAIGKKLH